MKLAQLLQILNEKASLMQKFSEVIFIEKEMQEICISFRADSSGMAVLMIGFSITHPCHFPFATTLYSRGACGGVGTLRPTFSVLFETSLPKWRLKSRRKKNALRLLSVNGETNLMNLTRL